MAELRAGKAERAPLFATVGAAAPLPFLGVAELTLSPSARARTEGAA